MLRAGNICLSFLYNYCKNQNKDEELDDRSSKIKCLSNTFSKYGGILSKISQLLNIDNSHSDVFSNCEPFSKEKTEIYFKEQLNNNILFSEIIDCYMFKSGSVGQVYKATNNKKQELIIKVQYVGLYEQTMKDINILEMLISYLYRITDMTHIVKNIKQKMIEELDYKIEIKNQNLMRELFSKDEQIIIPKIYKSMCNERIISMEYIDGVEMNQFLENSNQEEKNKIGMLIFRFIFENIYKNNILYSDIHYGNFLVKDSSKLCVLDFGCINYLEEDLVYNLKMLHLSLLNENKENFYDILKLLGVYNDNISDESKTYMYEYFRLQYEPFLTEEFEFNNEWHNKVLQKDLELMKDWILPSNMVYFNKIPYGLYHLLCKLKLKGSFKTFFENIFENIF